jgi:hypothetical protein
VREQAAFPIRTLDLDDSMLRGNVQVLETAGRLFSPRASDDPLALNAFIGIV